MSGPEQKEQMMKRRTVKDIRRCEAPAGFAATIEIGERTYGVSRLDGEDGWTIDSTVVTASGYPVHVNGYGARYLTTRRLIAKDAIDALDRAARDDAFAEERARA
jgi:hypothetical protein